ncbi:hypothetical protein RRG08_040669 [Elysia crispata]|uniref:Tyrosine-protein kinase ephrin type A/B receptor-like domain-containing protein n=1 Tax=Elysia crispata TaxID=231223 RepID=A0AAE0YY88_9GAST|nr:hypothetical protein RRG08_040669 [Elysia crispata]
MDFRFQYILYSFTCVACVLLLPMASSREFLFPMCPPKEWKIPGGKVKTDGKVEYRLVCQYGYTHPYQYNDVKGHVCEEGKPEKLPKRCIQKLYAYVTIEYGIAVELNAQNESICNDEHIEKRIKRANFRRMRRPRLTGKTAQGRTYFVNDQVDASTLRASVNACSNFNTNISYIRIHITNLPKGNGTDEEVIKYYYFVMAETFKYIKREITYHGFRLTAGQKSIIDRLNMLPLTAARSPGNGLQDGRAWSMARRLPPGVSDLDPSLADYGALRRASDEHRHHLARGSSGSPKRSLPGGDLAENSRLPVIVGPTVGAKSSAGVGSTAGTLLRQEKPNIRVKRGHEWSPGHVDLDHDAHFNDDPLFTGQSFVGLFNTHSGGYKPVDFRCPDHLVLKYDSFSEALCVGCGKGWILRKEHGKPKCYPCGPGFYSDVDTATTCLPCPVKYKNAPWDAGSIDDCFDVKVSTFDKNKWTLVGHILPFCIISLLTVAVVWISKVTVGISSYRRDPPSHRKSNKAPGN